MKKGWKEGRKEKERREEIKEAWKEDFNIRLLYLPFFHRFLSFRPPPPPSVLPSFLPSILPPFLLSYLSFFSFLYFFLPSISFFPTSFPSFFFSFFSFFFFAHRKGRKGERGKWRNGENKKESLKKERNEWWTEGRWKVSKRVRKEEMETLISDWYISFLLPYLIPSHSLFFTFFCFATVEERKKQSRGATRKKGRHQYRKPGRKGGMS